MSMQLPPVDGCALSEKFRRLLHPGEAVDGSLILPRFFYQVDTWEQAKEFKLTVHFTLAELMSVDCREAPELLHSFPHYVPCGVFLLARYLEELRARVEAPIFVAVNGGYRSPAHRFSTPLSVHQWATAANIYRIGDTLLDNEKAIAKYGKIAADIGQELRVKPYGHGSGETDDHLHLDLGYLSVTPHRFAQAEVCSTLPVPDMREGPTSASGA